jgi:Protein of unknown function (DUF1553)/Protein of unknown function (DUF1549)
MLVSTLISRRFLTPAAACVAAVLAAVVAPLPAGAGQRLEPQHAHDHWAYVKPVRPGLPAVADKAWVRNPIDAFVLARLEAHGLHPSPPADRARLIRRVWLDLIGLPPTPEQVAAFVNDPSGGDEAYEKVVDRLLASPRYGEKWARPWLDLARYADSNGFQADQLRDSWAYRDWVIHAFNADMPFDQFTVEQLAGDLLPNATPEQKIATGFHRTVTCNVEAGVDPEENRANQVIDRVNTTATVWLGTTLQCTQCHDHKYDPFDQKDFYQLFAFFNNTPLEVKLDSGVQYNFYGPKMDLPMQDDQRARRAKLADDEAAMVDRIKGLASAREKDQPAWEEHALDPAPSDHAGPAEIPPQTHAANPALPDAVAAILKKPHAKRSKKEREELRRYFVDLDPTIKGLRGELDKIRARINDLAPATTLVMVEMDKPRPTTIFKRGNFLDPGDAVQPDVPAVLHAWPKGAPRNRLGLAQWLVSPDNPLVGRVTVNRWWAQFFGAGIVATPEDFGTQGEPPTHPKLLDWLAVEFTQGTQREGEVPAEPRSDRGAWSMKHIHKLIVMSNTYRQSSAVTAASMANFRADPRNRLLSRGPRVRLDAETIRDNALAVSGLLSTAMGGPPIYPYQPPGLWKQVGRNEPKYQISPGGPGGDRYRRGIYVIYRRAAPYPSFVTFDAPDRGECVVQRPRTNTPLQALVLMNDPVYVEAAMALGARVLQELPGAGASETERIDYAFRRVLSRPPTPRETQLLADALTQEQARYENDAKAADTLVKSVQGWSPPQGIDAKELAAWFAVANTLLNLDETITKQ